MFGFLGTVLGIGKKIGGAIFGQATQTFGKSPVQIFIDGLTGGRGTGPTVINRRIEEIKADTKISVAQIDASKSSWKDEFGLFLVSGHFIQILLVGFIGMGIVLFNDEIPLGDKTDEMLVVVSKCIDLLAKMPTWLAVGLFTPVIFACFGIRPWRRRKDE